MSALSQPPVRLALGSRRSRLHFPQAPCSESIPEDDLVPLDVLVADKIVETLLHRLDAPVPSAEIELERISEGPQGTESQRIAVVPQESRVTEMTTPASG